MIENENFPVDIDIKFPPEGELIELFLREDNGERSAYAVIYMGLGIFKIISDNSQWAIIEKEGKLYLFDKEIISWRYVKEGDNKNG